MATFSTIHRLTLLGFASALWACGTHSAPESDAPALPIAQVGDYAFARADFERAGAVEDEDDPALLALVREARLATAARRAGLDREPAIAAEIAAAERRILARIWRERAIAESVTDRAVRSRFDASRDALAHTEITVQHVQVLEDPALRDTAPARARRDALNRATTLYARLESGVSFDALALEFADDALVRVSTAARVIRDGDVDPDFFARASALATGELSPPFQTGFGVHVVRATRPAVRRRPRHAEVAGRLRAELIAETERALAAELARVHPLHLLPRSSETP